MVRKLTRPKLMSRDLNEGKSNNIKIGNKSPDKTKQFKYLETNLINKNSINDEKS
jgi:hypothetical protein